MKVATLKPDSLDLAQLRDTLDSPGWRLIERRITDTINQQRAELELTKTWEDTLRVQAFIAGLRNALTSPLVLAKEYQGRIRT